MHVQLHATEENQNNVVVFSVPEYYISSHNDW